MHTVRSVVLFAGFFATLLGAASADWRIEGTGNPPTITIIPSIPPVAPPVPPLPPPPVPPLVTDTSPFPFPVAQPGQDTDGSCRYFNLCPNDGGCYTALPNCNNPLRNSHRWACFTPLGMLYGGTQSIGGFRMYVPADLSPVKIRLLCAGGAL